MGDLQFENDLLDEIAHRLELRQANRDAVQTVALRTSDHYDVNGGETPFECIVDSATGVGKTYVMAGLIEYFAGIATPARNFLVLAPGRTIRDKTIKNFSSGNAKSLTAAMRSQPFLVHKDNFKSPATIKAMMDPSVTKVYVFTVQALTSATGEGRETHEYQESLGCSLYDFIKGLSDLLVLADEHHCYRGKAYKRTISEMNPQVVVGLTATPLPADKDLIAFRYPLAAAIAHKVVKTPIMVGRRDDRNDTETKLLDGVTLLRYKEQALRAYCDETGRPMVNPVMLVIAKDIAEAEEFQGVLDSESFDNGAWIGRTLLVHSNLSGDEKEEALAALDDVEHPTSPVGIIISVGMLKEGWDVKNVYVIASMRASVSEVMADQSLGRGVRLPFGEYTGIELRDSVEVLAHEKYSELLARRKALNEAFINYGTYAATRTLPNGEVVVRNVTTSTEQPVIGTISTGTSGEGGDGDGPNASTPNDPTPALATGIVDVGTRNRQAEEICEQTSKKVKYEPLPGRAPIVIPFIRSVPTVAAVSLNDIDLADYGPFETLGRTLTTDYRDDLKRTRIVGRIDGDKAVTDVEAASGVVKATLALDIPLSSSKDSLFQYVMRVPGVQPRTLEVGAARRIVERVVDAMGDEAAVCLSAFGERCGQRLAQAVQQALKKANSAAVTYEDEVQLVALTKTREANKKAVAGHADGAFLTSLAFNGWKKNLYSHSWFDTKPEYEAANAIDNGNNVIVWARLHINDIPITWTSGGRKYNPDFVAIEQEGTQTVGWLIETKGNDRIDSAEVAEKRKAARKWANTVNASPDVNVEWRYLLLSEQDVYDAQGSWEFMKGFGS